MAFLSEREFDESIYGDLPKLSICCIWVAMEEHGHVVDLPKL